MSAQRQPEFVEHRDAQPLSLLRGEREVLRSATVDAPDHAHEPRTVGRERDHVGDGEVVVRADFGGLVVVAELEHDPARVVALFAVRVLAIGGVAGLAVLALAVAALDPRRREVVDAAAFVAIVDAEIVDAVVAGDEGEVLVLHLAAAIDAEGAVAHVAEIVEHVERGVLAAGLLARVGRHVHVPHVAEAHPDADEAVVARRVHAALHAGEARGAIHVVGQLGRVEVGAVAALREELLDRPPRSDR